MQKLHGFNISTFQSYVFPFEEQYPFSFIVPLASKYWSCTFIVVAIYVLAIYIGRSYMRDRPRYSLRGPLFAWNASLTAIYVFLLMRTTPEVLYKMRYEGLHSFVCVFCDNGCSIVYHFWCLVFAMLKFPELLDTAFVILRKQPLYFLHWYHHCTVLVFTWYLYGRTTSAGTMFAYVNANVHAIMYFYYSLKSLSIRVPRFVSMGLTLIQLAQMIIGVITNFYAYRMKQKGVPCETGDDDIWAAFVIYVSYFMLFTWYFYKAYLADKTPSEMRVASKKLQ